MAKLEIKTFPDPVLKKKALPVEKVTAEYKKLAKDMLETMYDAPGIGLAAPQVGVSIRMVVIDTRPYDDNDKVDTERMTELEQKVKFPVILFNPVITKKDGKTTYEEGCLSVPGFVEEVQRAKDIEVVGLDENGEKITIHTDGLLAICVQHELDHLDGKLFIDRLSPLKSGMIKDKIRKHGYPDKTESDNRL